MRKLKNEKRVYTNYELTNAVINLLTALEYTNGILAKHQAMLEGLCKITGITTEDIKKELNNGIRNQ